VLRAVLRVRLIVALRGSRGASILLELSNAFLGDAQLCGMLLGLDCSTAYKTLNLVDAGDMVLKLWFQTSRDCLDALLQSLSILGVGVDTTLAGFEFDVVLLALSLEKSDITSKFLNDLVGIGLFLFESCAFIHQVIHLVFQTEDLGVHLELVLLLLLTACALEQGIILRESVRIRRIHG
jgi:hypothetical protein